MQYIYLIFLTIMSLSIDFFRYIMMSRAGGYVFIGTQIKATQQAQSGYCLFDYINALKRF